MFERERNFRLLKEFVETDSLRKHCLAVEGSMLGYAKKYGEDLMKWGALGLLHDMDYEKYPDKHPLVAADYLREKSYDEDFVLALLGHADYTDTPRDTLMAKTLYAVDELSSFIIAVALVRPTKLEGLTPKSVKKKMKDKAFARAVNRDEIKRGAEELGVDLTEHIENVISFLVKREAELQAEGLTLL